MAKKPSRRLPEQERAERRRQDRVRLAQGARELLPQPSPSWGSAWAGPGKLAGEWDFSVFLAVAFEVTARRMAARDGSSPDPAHPSVQRYVQAQRPYAAACAP
jgi:hypothetical protein